MERILVLTDFSKIATKGLEAAVKLAEQLGGAEILLLNTELSASGGRFSGSADVSANFDREEDRYMVELIRTNIRRLQVLAANYSNEVVQIKPFMEIGPMQEIVDHFLEKHRVDLIVMGTSGENTFEEYFVGNHTEQVIRVADVPVLSVKQNDHLLDYRNIVLATDLHSDARKGLPPVKTLASKLGAKVHLVHVTSGKPEKVQKKIEEYAASSGLTNFTITVVQDNDTEEGIKKFAAQVGADMIAVITHGRNGLRALLSHSVAEDVIKEASVPVLTVNMNEIK